MAYNSETNMYEGYIYVITNKINGTQYIGQTNRTIEQRWKEHQLDCNKFKYAIYNAINLYGIENFNVKEIEKIYSDSKINLDYKLDKREIYWIDFYDTYYHGYNETFGGKNNAPNKYPERVTNEYNLQGELL